MRKLLPAICPFDRGFSLYFVRFLPLFFFFLLKEKKVNSGGKIGEKQVSVFMGK
jgi:hypothetical protein